MASNNPAVSTASGVTTRLAPADCPSPYPRTRRERGRRRTATALVALFVLTTSPVAATAATPGPGANPTPGPALLAAVRQAEPALGEPALPRTDVAGMSEGIGEVEVVSASLTQAQAEVQVIAERLTTAQADAARIEDGINELAEQQTEFGLQIADATERLLLLREREPGVTRSLQALAVADYVRLGSNSDPNGQIISDGRLDAVRQRRIVTAVQLGIRDLSVSLADNVNRTERELGLLGSIRQTTESDMVDLLGERTAGIDRVVDSLAALPDAIELVADQRGMSEVSGGDFPLVVMDAYWRAAATLAVEDPTCGIGWRTIAGVGRVESIHGRFGGSVVTPTGQTQGIIGRVLDGEEGFLEVVDTDQGLLDGDLEYDRAVGPMQFLPETWSREGRDGNGDGVIDPNNLYDAALAAAGYLCGGEDLTTRPGQVVALRRYNRSDQYGIDVLGFAGDYTLVDVPPVPDLSELWPPLAPTPASGAEAER